VDNLVEMLFRPKSPIANNVDLVVDRSEFSGLAKKSLHED
jgi:hypothetical protein